MIAVIDYGAGNLFSVAKALMKVGSEQVVITRDRADLARADRLVLPGVGAFGHCLEVLRDSGLMEVIEDQVLVQRKPLLAICIGLQLMARRGFEYGEATGLGWFDAAVVPFKDHFPPGTSLWVPHTGWNAVHYTNPCELFEGIPDTSCFYFNHSYFFQMSEPGSAQVATTHYGLEFTAAVQKGNIFACQFHPEKSQNNGLRLLKNFCAWDPCREESKPCSSKGAAS